MAHQRFMLLMLVLILSCLSPMEVAAVNPGFKARITQSGLDYLRDVGLEILRKDIQQLTIPDINGDANAFLIGQIAYTVSNIHIRSFAVSSATLTTVTGVGLNLQASGISLYMSGNWRYNNHWWIPVVDRGSFDGRMNGASLSLTLRIGVDTSGRPTVSSTGGDCIFNSGSVHVTLHSGASWLYNLFSGSINGAIQSALNGGTCDLITKEVNNDLQNQFSKLMTQAPIDDLAVNDYSFIAPPTFSGHIDTAHKGEVFPRNRPHTEAPYTVPTLPPDADDSRHLFLWITDYFFKTAGYVYYRAGAMKFTLTQDTLPPGAQISLKTSDRANKRALPSVYDKYPNQLMEVVVSATAPPSVNISEANVNASISLDLDVFVVPRNVSKVPLFTLNATVYGSSELYCDDSRLKWKSTLVEVGVGLKRSAIGKFDVEGLTGGIEIICHSLLPPWFNREGEKGLPLPTSPNVNLRNTVLKQGKGYIKLGADVVFTPSDELN